MGDGGSVTLQSQKLSIRMHRQECLYSWEEWFKVNSQP